MRPMCVVASYYLLNDETADHTNFKACLISDSLPVLETLKVRDRIGQNPTLNGSGPFFGANIAPWSVLNAKQIAGQSYWAVGTGHIVGSSASQFAHQGRHVYCLGDWLGECYFGIPSGLPPWEYASGAITFSKPTDLVISGVRQYRFESHQFYLKTYPGEKNSMDAWSTVQFVKRILELPYRISDTDGLTGYFDTTVSFIRVLPGWVRYTYELEKVTLSDFQQPSTAQLKYGEWLKAEELANGVATNKYYSGCAAAFQACVDSLPQTCVNTAQNIMDVVEGLWSLIQGKGILPKLGLKHLPHNAGQAWMWYRYVYSTSKSDLEEYKELTLRLADLSQDLGKYIFCYGRFKWDDFTFHCVMKLAASSVFPQGMKAKLKAYGIKLSAADYWDNIPYSFVVDWFLGIGDILSYIDGLGRAIAFRNEECWYSITSEYNGVNTYCRVPGHVIPYFPPAVTFHDAKKKTWYKRFVDGLVLLGP